MNYILKSCLGLVGLTVLSACAGNKATATFSPDKDSVNIAATSGNRHISGVYPHLTTYSHARINGKYGFGDECGIGAIVPWAGKLYMVNYAAHRPYGSEHKLYIVDKDKNMEIYPGSVGGTPAARIEPVADRALSDRCRGKYPHHPYQEYAGAYYGDCPPFGRPGEQGLLL